MRSSRRLENWVEETGELFVGEDFFPELHDEGDVAIHVAGSSRKAPRRRSRSSITWPSAARERIWIQNPYFLPEPAAIEALGRAVARGVDVRVMVPSAEASDMPIVQHAAHRLRAAPGQEYGSWSIGRHCSTRR